MEKDGQLMMARESKLPAEGLRKLEKHGVIIGEPVSGAPAAGAGVLMHVTLPEGWRIRPRDDHDMWSDVLDADDKVMATVFYKANLYDHRGHCNVE